MSRVKITFPDKKPSFSTQIPVLIQHINYGGHLGNDAILSVVHEARLRFFQHLGFSEIDAFGTGLIMTDSVVIYQGEGFPGDLLTITVVLHDLSSRGFDLYYRITCDREGQEIPIAEVKTGILCFDYTIRKPVSISEQLREKLMQ